MLLRPKSELRLRVGLQNCQATLWRGLLRPELIAMLEFETSAEPALVQVLQALAELGHTAPTHARICFEDELLYYSLHPASLSRREVDAQVRADFAGAVGEEPMEIVTRLSSCGSQWFSAAMPGALLEAYVAAMAEHKIKLHSVSAALADDLHALGPLMPNTGILALLRDEGFMLVGVVEGRLSDVSWERCNLGVSKQLTERIVGYVHRFMHSLADDQLNGEFPPVLLLPAHTAQQVQIEPQARARGWQLLSPLGLPDPVPAVEA